MSSNRDVLVSMLRARAMSEDITADRHANEPDKTPYTRERVIECRHAANVLREEAVRFEALPKPNPTFEALLVAIDFGLQHRLRVADQNRKRSTKAGTAEKLAWDRVLDVLREAAQCAPKPNGQHSGKASRTT